jgi:hypothetical protein
VQLVNFEARGPRGTGLADVAIGKEASDSQGDAVAPRFARAACTAAVNSDMRSGLLMKAAAPNAKARL